MGIANLITIVALYTLPFKDSMKVVGMRLIMTTLLGGTLSTFMYSAAGAVLSYLGMLVVKIIGKQKVSIIGVSATGGILHNLGQLFVASSIARTWTVLLSLPVLSFMGILSGIAIGIAANFLMDNHKYLEEKRNDIKFDVDGIVYKVNDFSLQKRLGFAANAPRWAIAHKFSANSSTSEILNIEIQLGRTGALTPVAKIKPVNISNWVIKWLITTMEKSTG